MKVLTFNPNGIRSAARNGFYEWLETVDPDFVCLQETKAQLETHPREVLYYPLGYYSEYYDAEKKGYSGVAIYAKHKPLNIVRGLGFDYCDQEGRYIQFDYPNLSIASIYFPSGTSGEIRQNVKYNFLERIAKHLIQLKKEGRELILCGDYNIAHKKIDLKNWRSNQNKSGFFPEERAWMDELFDSLGFVDAFRVIHEGEGHYTWWTYRSPTAFEKNVGWRIDYQVITPGLKTKVVDATIYRERRWSDHAPLIVEYAGDLYA